MFSSRKLALSNDWMNTGAEAEFQPALVSVASKGSSRDSNKPAEVRMGNGKGSVEYYVAEIQPGKVLYEIVGVPEQLAREAFTLAAAKLPLRTTFVTRMLGQ